jgi:hypothetical protein
MEAFHFPVPAVLEYKQGLICYFPVPVLEYQQGLSDAMLSELPDMLC